VLFFCCWRRVRVSGGYLYAKHRRTDRGGSRDLNQFAQRLCLCLHPQNIVVSGTAVSDTPCFSFFRHPLHRPPGARVPETPCYEPTRAHPHGRSAGSSPSCTKSKKRKGTPYGIPFLLSGKLHRFRCRHKTIR